MACDTRTLMVVFEHDQEPDYSWLDQDHYKTDPVYRTKADMDAGREPLDPEWFTDPDNHVALEMLVYAHPDTDDEEIVDSLGNIDFLADEGNWCTGTFYRVSDIPARCTYQRELAREAGLPE